MAVTSPLGRGLLLVGRLALAAVFLAAGLAKLGFFSWAPGAGIHFNLHSQIGLQLSYFALQVDSYQILPPWAVTLVAHCLPWTEVALALWLVSGWKLRWSGFLATLLLGGFFAVVARSYALGLEINCGCFGPNERLDKMTLVRDGALVLTALAVTVGAFLSSRAPLASSGSLPAPQKAR